ncbi:DUF1287 domain-containing protein [Ereboglobus luteus]|uniref:DUF1287 domain-containing protein n=2 Tax=Ereboglobus luteus TaxID=1796921 RepID=A0A2U8E788_9BACT|nr:DUF1287 domain-containing protein [Ereboglobus luteus]
MNITMRDKFLKRTALLFFLLVIAASASAALPKITPSQTIAAARAQIGVTTSYDPAYRKIGYPNGDVPIDTGVCADVIVRALRKQNADLQQLVHEDMRANFSAYPKIWGLRKTDKNIDHRRVPNLCTYFKRAGKSVAVTDKAADYKPGDIVAWNLRPKGSLPHIGIVSDKKAPDGTLLIIHNIGSGTREENILFQYQITGHFRL